MTEIVSDLKRERTRARESIRYLLNIHPRTHNDYIPALIEAPNVEYQIYCRIMSFFHKGYNHVNEYISFFFRNCMMGLYSYMSKNIYCIASRIKSNFTEMMIRPLSWIKNKCRPKVAGQWQTNMIKELLLCRDGTLECQLSKEEINDLITSLCIE